MEDPAAVQPITSKRPLEEDVASPFTTPVKAIRSEASSPLSVRSVQTPSPLKFAPSATAPSSNNAATASDAAQPPPKRRKLTQQEKDDMRIEKESKARAREEKKALKEAEEKLKAEQKAQREEEKRLREEEKQKKTEEREEKRRQKEEEQQQKEEEKAKKERSQMKLNAFFAKPKNTGNPPGKAAVGSTQTSSAAPPPSDTSLGPSIAVTPSPQKGHVKNAQSDYEKYFLPFSLPAHTILAPTNALMENLTKVDAARTRLEALIAQENVSMKPTTPQQMTLSLPRTSRGYMQTQSVADIVENVNNSSERPIDLTDDRTAYPDRPLDMLREIPMKYIHFSEDVRPPYFGTYTQSYTTRQATRLARNPTSRVRQDTNYDYDSEAEWDEPEEGEDLDSEDDEDAGEDAEDDMDGFLDDAEDPQLKRRLISGDLQPISTGLCWQDEHGVSRLNDGSGAICTDFRDFSMGFLLDSQPTSIDPFSTTYWTLEPASSAPTSITTSKDNANNSAMNPPRAPLTQRTMNGLLNTLNTPSKAPSGTNAKSAKVKRMIPPEQLPAFKAEIDGKDLTKIGMIEALKKVFPKLPKDAITNTLSVVAARVGPTEKEKRWVLVNT